MTCTSLLMTGAISSRSVTIGVGAPMLYYAYQLQSDLMKPVRAMADAAANLLTGPLAGQLDSPTLRNLAAAFEMVSRAGLTHARPPFGIDSVRVGDEDVPVTEEAAFTTPFGTLLRFRKASNAVQPRVLVVAPLSGHFATLLRNTVAVLLPEHDVYITDWHNARDVGVEHGRFGFDEYVDHVIRFLEELGPGAHLVSVCQPCAHAFAAVAVMAQTDNPAQPASMTLMAGPIDTRINPTTVNELATTHSIDWFERNLISRVPRGFPGAGRRVYPGFVQLNAFMSMNPKRHVDTHIDLFGHLAKGDLERAETTKTFYDEYFAVLDLTAEFYLETVNLVFQRACAAERRVDLARRTGRTRRDQEDGAADGRGRARRHLLRRPDARGAGPLHRHQTLQEAPSFAGRRRPLRRFLGFALGRADLSDRPQHDPRQRLNAAPGPMAAAPCRPGWQNPRFQARFTLC